MRLEDIAPGRSLDGIAPGAPVTVLAVLPLGPDAVGVVYRDLMGGLGERLVARAHEPGICVPLRRRPWAMDAEGAAFLRAVDACREALRAGDAGPGAMEAGMSVRQGAFLVDPALRDLGPRLLWVVAGPGRRAGGTVAPRRLVLVQGSPDGDWAMAGEHAHRTLLPSRPEDQPWLNRALGPLIADAGLRSRAMEWLASSQAAGPDPAEPPVLLGGAIVVSPLLGPWLRQADGGAGGISAPRPSPSR